MLNCLASHSEECLQALYIYIGCHGFLLANFLEPRTLWFKTHRLTLGHLNGQERWLKGTMTVCQALCSDNLVTL